jgi:antitoxin YefM
MRTANYSDLKSNLKGYIDSVTEKEMEYILSSPRMVQRIKEAQEEMLAGKGKTINIDDLWK